MESVAQGEAFRQPEDWRFLDMLLLAAKMGAAPWIDFA